jgi:flagella basal body P-ring formation protein FlgA
MNRFLRIGLMAPWAFAAALSVNAWESAIHREIEAPPPLEEGQKPVVRRGQQVLLVATAEGIRLSAPGRALKNGQTGDLIPVLNTATRKPLKGIVRDGWVEIQAMGESNP